MRTAQRHAMEGIVRLTSVLAAILCITATSHTARAQYPVLDEGMVSRNQETHYNLILDQLVERQVVLDFTRAMMLHLANADFEWRDVDALALAVEDLLDEHNVMGYSRSDVLLMMEEAFPGFDPVPDWTQQRKERVDRIIATHRAILLSIEVQQDRWADDQARLDALKARIDAVGMDWSTWLTPALPEIAPRQRLMELRTNARAYAQQEALLLREMFLGRSLLRTIAGSDVANRKANLIAVTERALGIP